MISFLQKLGVTAHISCCCSEMQNVSSEGCMHTTQIPKKYIKSTEQVQNKLVRTCSRAFSSKYLNTLQYCSTLYWFAQEYPRIWIFIFYLLRYNSGGKKFTKIHTKSLTVTIDAFTIHNALWLGKKAKLPDKRDMALVV